MNVYSLHDVIVQWNISLLYLITKALSRNFSEVQIHHGQTAQALGRHVAQPGPQTLMRPGRKSVFPPEADK